MVKNKDKILVEFKNDFTLPFDCSEYHTVFGSNISPSASFTIPAGIYEVNEIPNPMGVDGMIWWDIGKRWGISKNYIVTCSRLAKKYDPPVKIIRKLGEDENDNTTKRREL